MKLKQQKGLKRAIKVLKRQRRKQAEMKKNK